MQYAKIINENEVEFPKKFHPKYGWNFHINLPKLEKEGFKPFISQIRPNDGKLYKAKYELIGVEIHQVWLEVPTPHINEPTAEQKRKSAYRATTDELEAELSYKMRKGYPFEELKALEAEIDERRTEIKNAFPDTEENSNA